MHHKYHTEGIILFSRDVGENDRVYGILARELGFVYARARGVRRTSAKLSRALQDYTVGSFSFVRIGEAWKLTNAEEITNVYFALREAPYVRDALLRVLTLARTLVRGEEADQRLYDTLAEGVLHAARERVTPSGALHIEILLVLRILHVLGYLPNSPVLAYLISSPYITDRVLAEVARVRSHVLSLANRSLRTLPF